MVPLALKYDQFVAAFLSKVLEYDFANMEEDSRDEIVSGYLMRACANFDRVCPYSLLEHRNNETGEFDVDIPDEEVDEIVDIVSDGMVCQWIRPMMWRQEIMENLLNTRDFTSYSNAELLYRITNAYEICLNRFNNRVKAYSYDHGDLTELHI